MASARSHTRRNATDWWRGQHVCVTGGSGFVGRHLVRRLGGYGVSRIVSLYRSSPGPGPPGVVGVQGSILDPALVRHAVRGCSIVVHLAAETRQTVTIRASGYDETNANGTDNVARACEEAGVRTLIYASTGYVYGFSHATPVTEEHRTAPAGAYAVSKLAGERAVLGSAGRGRLTAIVVRLANVYGGDSAPDTVIGQAIRQVATGAVAFRDHSPVRDFVHVDEVVEALVRLPPSLDAGYTVVNVSTGTGTSVGELARTIADVAFQVGLGTARIVSPPMAPTGPVSSNVLDATRLHALTGWRPSLSLPAGLRRALLDAYGCGRLVTA
jgi:UDP-glucose 4-epimerase